MSSCRAPISQKVGNDLQPSANTCLALGTELQGCHCINVFCRIPCRALIARTVADDPEQFTEAFLERANDEYCAWILDESKWGGAIELAILSKWVCCQPSMSTGMSNHSQRYRAYLAGLIGA